MKNHRILNIFNGDCMAEDWRNGKFPGEVLVWRENYLPGFGKIDLSWDCQLWSQHRAEFLVKTVPELDIKSIKEYLVYMEEALQADNLKKYDLVYLFFDRCIYDFGLLMRIFWKLSKIPAGQLPELKLILDDDLIRETPEYWKQKIDESKIIGSNDLILTAQLYQAYAAGREAFAAAAESITLSWHDCYEYDCMRLLCEMPPPGELTQTELNILDILKSGAATPIEIFKKLDNYEKQLFLGDSGCWHILDGLADRKLIKIEGNEAIVSLCNLSFSQLKSIVVSKL